MAGDNYLNLPLAIRRVIYRMPDVANNYLVKVATALQSCLALRSLRLVHALKVVAHGNPPIIPLLRILVP